MHSILVFVSTFPGPATPCVLILSLTSDSDLLCHSDNNNADKVFFLIFFVSFAIYSILVMGSISLSCLFAQMLVLDKCKSSSPCAYHSQGLPCFLTLMELTHVVDSPSLHRPKQGRFLCYFGMPEAQYSGSWKR